MKKDDLLKIEGLTDTMADSIMTMVKADFITKERFNEVNEAKKNAEALVTERDNQITELSKAQGATEELKKQIETLQADNAKVRLESAVTLSLKDAGARNIKAVLPFITANEFDKDGSVKGLSEQIEALKKSDSYLFNAETPPAVATPSGATPITSPKGAKTGVTKEDFNRMNYKQRVELFNSDRALYDSFTKDE